MIDKIKNNTKIKLISLLSAVLLWLYVMAIVDPEEVRLFENIPITINNLSELEAKELEIYPEMELTADISITGKISKLKNINKNNIHIYGDIKNPIEGQNEIYLKANTPGQVSHEIRNNILIVNLEKIISETKDIEIQLQGKSKSNVDKVITSEGEKNVIVNGPRTLVEEVDKVIATLDVGSKTDDFSTEVDLIPVDKQGNIVEGVKLDKQSISVDVTLLKEKDIPIKINFIQQDDKTIDLSNYIFSQDTVLVKGQKDVLENIEYIETETIDTNNISFDKDTNVYLKIPQDVVVSTKYITIRLDKPKLIKETLTYTSEEIELRNKNDELDITTIQLPTEINVNIEYEQKLDKINKSDIVLYIDLSQETDENKKYDIKYETNLDLKSIIIEQKKTS